jgi:hypothetical protein
MRREPTMLLLIHRIFSFAVGITEVREILRRLYAPSRRIISVGLRHEEHFEVTR